MNDATKLRTSLPLPLLTLVAGLLAPQLGLATELAVPRTEPIYVNDRGEDSMPASDPTLAIDSSGGVAVAWVDGNVYGSLDDWGTAIAGQLVSAEGALVGPNRALNGVSRHDQGFPRMAVTNTDEFWLTYNTRTVDGDGSPGIGQTVFGTQLESGANTATIRNQVAATVATSASGHQVAVWQSNHLDPWRWEIFASLDGGVEFRVSGDQDGDKHARVAMDAAGNFAVVWQRNGDLIMRAYDPVGTPLSAEFIANPSVAFTQDNPEIAALATGGYLVVWEDDDTNNRTVRVMGRVFDVDGTALGDRFAISDDPNTHAVDPVVATDPNGRAVVVWVHNPEIRGRVIDPINQSMGPVFETGVMSQVQQGQPAVAMGEADEFAVAWYSHANPSRIYLRQYDIVEE